MQMSFFTLLAFTSFAAHAQAPENSPLQKAATATRHASDAATCTTRCERPLDVLAANRANQQAAAALLSGGTASETTQKSTGSHPEYQACVEQCMKGN